MGGGLAAYVGVKQLLGELNKPGGPDIETVAQCVVVAITLAIVAGGFFLIRLGFRKPKASSASAESNAAGPVANIPEFGRLIAKCGPQRSGQTHYVVFGAAMMAGSPEEDRP